MSWTLLLGLVVALGIALFAALSRRIELTRMRRRLGERERVITQGGADAKLALPVVDLSRCLGCGTCVEVCPEDVLGLVHGQAAAVNPARCEGIAACERECPVGAITVTIANLEKRTDVPALSDGLEALGTSGLFLAGEVTAHALIKTAIEQGTAVGAEVARRVAAGEKNGVLDLCVVGAGPAGLACSLEAKRHGLSFVTLDQEHELGGTVAKYPRRKLVLTQPVDLPLHGRLKQTSYTKEELIDLWRAVAREQELPIKGGEVFAGCARDEHGHWVVSTQSGTYAARHVCLALGRRGSPQQLGVPGEDLPKVAYSLLDAHSYQGRRVLVVGGGDSAVESALALAEQPGNRVTLSYRRESFFRIRARNEERLKKAVAGGALSLVLKSRVLAIDTALVELEVEDGSRTKRIALPNDDVFVMAGGIPPFDVLSRSGVSFDPALRPTSDPVVEQGTGLLRALTAGFVLALTALLFAVWHGDYYMLSAVGRPAHPKHAWLRPAEGLGLWLGIAATVLVVVNLLYLVRRSPRLRLRFGSLQAWMTSHMATGILALLCALLHGAMDPGDTAGGHAFWALAALLVTGAIGRYFYAWVPRAANGRELELEEVKLRLARTAEEWDAGRRRFQEHARAEITALVERRQWKGTFLGRALGLLGVQLDLRRTLQRLEREGAADVPPAELAETLALARRAHRTALMAAHYEDVRAVLATWRWLHRWMAALLVALIAVHVGYALAYGELWGGAG